MHGQKIKSPNNNSIKNFRLNQEKSRDEVQQSDLGSWNPERWWENPQEFAKMQNMIANSNQTFDLINNLQWQVNSLQQQIGSCQRQISDMLSHNWLSPKRSIQGISGYICKKCNNFGLKPIFDLGYDMTMHSRHRCNERDDKKNYQNFPIPPNIQNCDVWAARIMVDYLRSHTHIGKFLFSKDVTQGFNNFNQVFTPDITEKMIGIPDRYYICPLKSDDRIIWLERAINDLGKEILLTDDELSDFLTKSHSTYAIFEIPMGREVRRISFALTAN
jgi:hypothetical protein